MSAESAPEGEASDSCSASEKKFRYDAKAYHDEQWLRYFIEGRGKTATEIAEYCGIQRQTLMHHVRKHEIDTGHTCPTCGKISPTQQGNRNHHKRAHDESLRLIEFECDVCGATDEKEPHHYNEDGANYCSHDCQAKDLEKRKTVNCEWCGEDLVRDLNQVERSENFFCGDKDCRGKWQSENVKAETHPQFDPHSHRNYGPNWTEQATKCRERDDYECQICGAPQEKFDRALHVHHIKPRKHFIDEDGKYDYKTANRLHNLIALCNSCHGKYGDWGVIPTR